MGYYVDLYFDKSKNYSTRESIIAEFCQHGLTPSNTFDLVYKTAEEGFCYALSVYDKREDPESGCFIAELRFSWGTGSDVFQKSIENLFLFSKDMDFIIYDGQRNVYFDETNIKLAGSIFKGTQSVILGMLGTVNDK